jgi:hypothetical protein
MTSSRSDETAWIDVEIRRNHYREDAVLVSDGERDVWIARSQIKDSEDDLDEGTHTKIEIPEWLAAAKGLV